MAAIVSADRPPPATCHLPPATWHSARSTRHLPSTESAVQSRGGQAFTLLGIVLGLGYGGYELWKLIRLVHDFHVPALCDDQLPEFFPRGSILDGPLCHFLTGFQRIGTVPQ